MRPKNISSACGFNWRERVRLSRLFLHHAKRLGSDSGQSRGYENRERLHRPESLFLNGLEVAHRFFAEWGLPFLQEHFPGPAEHTAAGLFRGSQVLGADDALSRDHGWGPMFLLLLTEEDYAAQGQAVAQALVELPTGSGWPLHSENLPALHGSITHCVSYPKAVI